MTDLWAALRGEDAPEPDASTIDPSKMPTCDRCGYHLLVHGDILAGQLCDMQLGVVAIMHGLDGMMNTATDRLSEPSKGEHHGTTG